MRASAAGRLAGLLALASAGALSAHAVGYSTATLLGRRAAEVSHGHLAVLGFLGGVAAAVGVLVLAAAGARRTTCCAGVALRPLLWAQVAVYAWLEVSERLLHGAPLLGLLTAPVLLGLAAQPLTAWTLVLLLTVTTSAARQLLRRPERLTVPARTDSPCTLPSLRRPRLVLPSSGSRAPPITA